MIIVIIIITINLEHFHLVKINCEGVLQCT